MSWFKQPAPKKPAPAQIAVVTRPPTLNPSQAEQQSYAVWRIAHIERWLKRNEKTAPADKVEHLKAERDMYNAMLRMKP